MKRMYPDVFALSLELEIKSRLQPIIDLTTNKIIAHEILSTITEHINTEAFFNGLHYDALFKILKWQVLLLNSTSCGKMHRFCLNISPELMLSKKCIDWICKNSKKKLALEVDFSLLNVHTLPSLSILNMLWGYGHEVWLDDFKGTSDNPLFMDIPWDVVKIDKSVLWSVGNDEGELISYITEIKKHHKKLLMEGVETIQQVKACKKSFVELGQGFYWDDTFVLDHQNQASVNGNIVLIQNA
ncbi:EAL domain-containing protein [Aeromonas lacus]